MDFINITDAPMNVLCYIHLVVCVVRSHRPVANKDMDIHKTWTPPQCTSQHTPNIMQYNAPAVQYIDDGAALSSYWKLSLAWSQHECLKLIANQSGPGNILREQGTIIGCCQL